MPARENNVDQCKVVAATHDLQDDMFNLKEPEECTTIWRLCTFKENSVVDHVALTRFNSNFSQSVNNLSEGKYVLYAFIYKGESTGEPVTPTSPESTVESPIARTSSKGTGSGSRHIFRSTIRTATLGMFGKLEVQLNWRLITWKEGSNSQAQIISTFAEVLTLDDKPAVKIHFTISKSDGPATALLNVSSTSTITALNVAVQLCKDIKIETPSSKSSNRKSRTIEQSDGYGTSPDVKLLNTSSIFIGAMLGFSSVSTSFLLSILAGLYVLKFIHHQLQYDGRLYKDYR